MNPAHRVYLIGAFHEMIELLERTNFEIIGLIDSKAPNSVSSKPYEYLGDDQWLLQKGPRPGEETVIVSPDSPHVRSNLSELYLAKGFQLGIVTDGLVSPSAQISEGSVIQHRAVISSNVVLKKGVKVNVGALVMHDVFVGPYVTIAPAAVILGGAKIHEKAYIGANATVMPGIEIGKGAVIGAGAVVTKNIPEGIVVKGVPAK